MIEAITVTDPGHPLYGRRFASASAQLGASGYVYVAHRSGTTLRLPVAATSLHPLPRSVTGTKLTLEAIHDLLRLTAEGEHAFLGLKGTISEVSCTRCAAA